MPKITKDQGLKIATEYYFSTANGSLVKEITASFDSEYNQWVVFFHLDITMDPGAFIILVDADTGKPMPFHPF